MVTKQTKKTTVPRKKTQSRVKKPVSTTVDYYPNRMTVAISVLAGTVIVLFALIAVLGL